MFLYIVPMFVFVQTLYFVCCLCDLLRADTVFFSSELSLCFVERDVDFAVFCSIFCVPFVCAMFKFFILFLCFVCTRI